MIEINAGMVAVFVTILLSLLGMAVAWGTLREKVKQHDKDIESNRNENRQDHKLIFQKLDDIKKEISNGRHSVGG